MNQTPHAPLKEFLSATLSLVQLGGSVDVQEHTRDGIREIAVAVTIPDHAEVLIGEHGQVLDALEHIVRLIHGRRTTDKTMVTVDINGYRHTRLGQVVQLAEQTAERVRASGQAETLMAMNSQERRAVHTTFTEYPGIVTESIGQEPTRRIVIKAAPVTGR